MQSRTAAAPLTAGTTASGGAPEGAPALPPRISWGAVIAGGIVAVTVGAMLNVLGVAVGFTTMDPATPGESPSATTLGLMSGIWLLVANLIGLGIGGWVAARLSGTADDTDGVLHGLSVWAVGFLLSAVLLGSAVSGATGAAMRGASAVLGSAGQAVGQAAQAVAPQLTSADPNAMLDRMQQALQTGGDPAAMNSEQRRAEMAQILGQRVTQGDFQGGQRDRLAQLVAAEYGIPPQEANNRISQMEQQARDAAARAETQAREAAEAASNAAATGAYWLFTAMILGAVAAVLGARIGTRHMVAHRAYT